MTTRQSTTPAFIGLRANPAFAALIASAVATAKNDGVKIDAKQPENNLKAATSMRDYAGLERSAMRIMKMRGQPYTDENFKAVVADIAQGKLNQQEQYRATIAFEGDATSIHTATRGIQNIKPAVPLFALVEVGDPTVRFDTGAWKENERFQRLGRKMQLVAGASAPVVGKYLN